MKRIFLLVMLVFVAGLLPAQAITVSRIAAVVNDEIITTHQLDLAVQSQLTKLEKRPSPAQVGALRKQLLSRLIEETLVQQRIRELNLSVNEEEVETAILDVQKQNNLTREDLANAVLAQGLTMEQYEENLRKQILRYKLLGEEVRSKVDVSEREVREYYRAHLDEYRSAPKTVLSALVFPVPEKAGAVERDGIRQVARQAMSRLRQGEALDQVAESYMTDYGASASRLGSFSDGELDPQFVESIQGVEPGGLGTLIEKETSLLILQVDEQELGGLRQFEAVQFEIYQTIADQKTDAKIKQWTQGLKQKAFIDIRL
jgi:peptidyl-prolyl cis-trans isomerase SurA